MSAPPTRPLDRYRRPDQQRLDWRVWHLLGRARAHGIADTLGVSPQAVLASLRRLRAAGLVDYNEFDGCYFPIAGTVAAYAWVEEGRP